MEVRMGGHMVTVRSFGVKQFFMVNNPDPDQACKEVARHASTHDQPYACAALSDETLAHFDVKPDEPWLCFTANPQPGANIGEGWGIAQTAFSDVDPNITEVGGGRCDLRWT
jgi:hypothetical protein